MKIAAFAISAALLGLVGVTPASAAPSAPTGIKAALALETGVVDQAQYRNDKRRAYRKGYRKGHRHGYRAGHRYNRAPAGWRRYSARPYGWQTRGCIVVGPVWFCP
ncbi:hypothetical protein [Hyphomicrobium sp. CS1GBMeth3]|uniref:hypothetical protein n=1 Tax=Hyphomicrobium sp. CS1GBMeth3 TaxID=1892845 RepID=UPI0009F9ED87|nr:hypothetical protein [Hyphomicrobium sp. CS1GBMeth3]